MARIDHAAIWTDGLERLREFYEGYLGGKAGPLYENAAHGFRSYFLDFGGVRLELMQMRLVDERPPGDRQRLGFAHVAFALGSEEAVDALTARLERDGYAVLHPPRRTGDGFYESAVADPDGNRLELTA